MNVDSPGLFGWIEECEAKRLSEEIRLIRQDAELGGLTRVSAQPHAAALPTSFRRLHQWLRANAAHPIRGVPR